MEATGQGMNENPSCNLESQSTSTSCEVTDDHADTEPVDPIFFNRINDLAIQTLHLIESHSDRSDKDMDHLWDQPHKIFEMLRNKTNEMKEAWADYYSVRKTMDEIAHKKELEEGLFVDEEFKRLYMIKATEAFQNELDSIRRGDQANEKKKSSKSVAKLDPTSIHMLDVSNTDEPSSNESIDFEVLATCLEDGHDLWTMEEKQLLIEECRKNNGR
jgi:hypothetical protein